MIYRVLCAAARTADSRHVRYTLNMLVVSLVLQCAVKDSLLHPTSPPIGGLICNVDAEQSLYLVHTGKPTGVAVSHCMTWFQTQLILTTCQIRYHAIVGSS